MKRFLCALAGCLCLLLPLMAQSNKLIKELESKRGALQKQIAESESLLQTTTKNVGSQLKGLAALTGQIEERKRYILAINSDMDAIDRELVSLERQLNQLQKELKDKKTKYAASVNYLYRNHTIQDKLLFIFPHRPWSRPTGACATSASMLPTSACRAKKSKRNRNKSTTSAPS